MAEKRTERLKRTRERILAAAEKLFNIHGVRLTGVDAISADAGLTKVTLYKHFQSKDELLAEVLRRRETNWREWFEKAVDSRATEPRAKLLATFDVLEEWFRSPDFQGSMFINITVENRSLEHPVDVVIRDHMQKNRAYFRTLAEAAGMNDLDLREEQLIGIYRGAVVTALVDKRPEAAQAAKKTVELLLA